MLLLGIGHAAEGAAQIHPGAVAGASFRYVEAGIVHGQPRGDEGQLRVAV